MFTLGSIFDVELQATFFKDRYTNSLLKSHDNHSIKLN